MTEQQKKNVKGWQVALAGAVIWIIGRMMGGTVGSLILLAGTVLVIYGALLGVYSLIKKR